MEFLLTRFRNLMVLVATVLAQLVLLAYQVRSNGEVRLIRVWAVSAVTPLARVIEAGRSSTVHFFRDYFILLDVRDENKRMKDELDRTKMENQYLRTELSTADRARSLAIFQQTSPSKTIAAHIIGNTTGVGANVVIVDRGTGSGVEKGMAVITPDGIVGKITGVYPTASFVLLITDPSFAAGVVSQANHVHGTLKGQGYSTLMVDYVQNEQKVDPGEWFYTSGDDRIFPKGMPVGQATVVRNGKARKEIYVTPSGLQNGLEEVLIVVEGVHVDIPDAPPPNQPVHMQDAPPGENTTDASPAGANPPSADAQPPAPAAGSREAAPALVPSLGAGASGPATDADRLVDRYRKIGEAQKHVYGGHGVGAPNYNINPDAAPQNSPASATPGTPGATPHPKAGSPASPANAAAVPVGSAAGDRRAANKQ